MSAEKQTEARWLPLESNPEVMDEFVHKLGVSKAFGFSDVYGLDPELLAMVPQPCKAVLLLFPITDKYEEFRKEEQTRIEKEGQQVSDKVYFMRQYIGNACGTIGILHAIGNNMDQLNLTEGPLRKYFDKTASVAPESRSKVLEQDQSLAHAHETSAREGQTAAPTLEDEVNLHFICFIEKDGLLYELDGRKPFPINHGPIKGDLLSSAAATIKQFIEREQDLSTFNVISLGPRADY